MIEVLDPVPEQVIPVMIGKRRVELRVSTRGECRALDRAAARAFTQLPDDGDGPLSLEAPAPQPERAMPGFVMHAEAGHTSAPRGAIVAALAGVPDMARLRALLMDVWERCPDAVEASLVLCQQHGGTFGPADCDACRATASDDTWVKASDGKPGIPCDCGRRLPWPELRGPDVTCPDCGAVYEHDGITIGGGARLKALGTLPGDPVTDNEPDPAAVIEESIRTGQPVIVNDDGATPERAWPAVPFLAAEQLLTAAEAAGDPCACSHGDRGHEQPDSDDGQPGGCLVAGCGCRSYRPADAAAGPRLVVPLIIPGRVITADASADDAELPRPFPPGVVALADAACGTRIGAAS